MQKLIILFLFFGQSLLAQIKIGTYSIVSNSSQGSIELTIREDNTFVYNNRNHASCFVWYKIEGNWKVNIDKLILTDFVKSFSKDFNKSITLRRTTIYYIVKNDLIFKTQYCAEKEPDFMYSRALDGNFSFVE